MDKDPRSLCTNCQGKEGNIKCDCHDWSAEMWNKVSTYRTKLAAQREKKEEGKSKASSSSFSGSLHSVHSLTSGNTEPIKWSSIHAYRYHLMVGSPPPHNGGNRAILTNR